MITLGADYMGPELKGSPIYRLISSAMTAAIAARGDWIEGVSPGVNVVFYVPGSLGGFDIPKIEGSRFSRKQKCLLVAVPVPKEVADAGGSVEFVIDALHKANTIAADVFARKGPGPFDLARAEAIVEHIRKALVGK